MSAKNSKNNGQFRSASKLPLLGFALAFIVAIGLSIFVVQSTLNEHYRNRIISDAADSLQVR
ncbi:MAG: hypothetical protein ACI96P_002356, partial [Candidatus Azotimanducaceae bacterium]